MHGNVVKKLMDAKYFMRKKWPAAGKHSSSSGKSTAKQAKHMHQFQQRGRREMEEWLAAAAAGKTQRGLVASRASDCCIPCCLVIFGCGG